MYYYMHISLNFEKDEIPHITPAFFKENIIRSVRTIFGEYACNADIDILKYNPRNLNAILRVPEHLYVKIHASLTFCGSWQGRPCYYTVHKVSPLLLSISHDSRNYEH
ncbi:ribonuclease P protein subunit p14-like [Coccinella septempunctata]|uniref:ribonuclease P protein subunit p14-like n=1 Tax=Coccinella septempunctata TaxID=41139 RepID=UPI001D068080|nr:ribonuclease P protein subunit p14-like [Coccinella septempunctata]